MFIQKPKFGNARSLPTQILPRMHRGMVQSKHNLNSQFLHIYLINFYLKKTNTCPIDRKTFHFIVATIVSEPGKQGPVVKKIPVEDKVQQNNDYDNAEDVTYCEVCHRCDREDRMLLCDGCDRGYHCECLNPRIETIPEGQWFCVNCRQENTNTRRRIRRVRRPTLTTQLSNNQARLNNLATRADQVASRLLDEEDDIDQDEINDLLDSVIPTTSRLRQNDRRDFIRPIARTRFMERVRNNVNENRIQRGGYIIETEDEQATDVSSDYTTDATDSQTETEGNEADSNIPCPCIMCDKSCKVVAAACLIRPVAARKRATKRRRKTTKRRKVNKDSKTTGKPKRRVKRRRKRRVVRRINPSVSIQQRILNSMQAAQQKQLEAASSREHNPITMSSIELELMSGQDKANRRAVSRDAKKNPAWFTDSILNEIDELEKFSFLI